MILAINTSSDLLEIALADRKGQIAAKEHKAAHANQASLLMPAIEALLDGYTPNKLTGIICALGPGSFTGIRIGLSTANALAYAWDLPVVGVSNLDLLAMYALDRIEMMEIGTQPIDQLVSLIDAGREEAYTALYRPPSNGLKGEFSSWEKVQPYQVRPLSHDRPDNVFESITSSTLLIGQLRAKHAAGMAQLISDRQFTWLNFDTDFKLIDVLARQGARSLAQFASFDQTGQLKPLYIRAAHITKSKKYRVQ